jgi:hypothetical protein
MTGRPRRLVVILVFAAASMALVATTPSYTQLGGQASEVISLSPEAPAALRSFSVILSAAALPDLDTFFASRTYGQVVVDIPDDAVGVEVAVARSGTEEPPAFVPAAGQHVVFDADDCDLLRECRRGIDMVLRLADGAAATDVSLTIRSGVYYPASSLPDGATLSFAGLDVPARPVGLHTVQAEQVGDAVLDPARPLDMTIRYTPASGTLLRLHGGQLSGRYMPGGAAPSAGSSAPGTPSTVLGIEVRRGATVDTVQLAPGETVTQPITPLATCLANCELTYRLVLTPTPAPADAAARLAWRASAWVLVLTEPGGSAPRLELEAVQAPAG